MTVDKSWRERFDAIKESEARLNVQLGEMIQARREHVELSVKEVADALHVNAVTIRNIERGLTTVSVAKLYTIAAILGCPVADLLPQPEKPL